MRIIFAAIAAATLVGCATAPQLRPNEYVFSFDTLPTGAMLYFGNGKAIGTAPYRSTFSVDPRVAAQDVASQKFIVVWPSGARLEQSMTWRPKDDRHWRFVFSRPEGAPNLSVDLENARATQAQRADAAMAAQQKARSEQKSEPILGNLLQSLMDGYNARPSASPDSSRQPSGPVTCSTRRITMGRGLTTEQYEVHCR